MDNCTPGASLPLYMGYIRNWGSAIAWDPLPLSPFVFVFFEPPPSPSGLSCRSRPPSPLLVVCVRVFGMAADVRAFARTATELYRDVALAEKHHLPPHDHDRLKRAIEEVKYHSEEAQNLLKAQEQEQDDANGELGSQDWTSNPASAAAVLVHYESILRNKRLMLAYVHERCQKIKAFRWRLGNAVPKEIVDRMAPEEVHFATQYNRILSEYMTGAGVDDRLGNIDLTLDATLPPKEPYVKVLVKRDIGEFVTEEGKTVHLIPGSMHLLRRCDAEPLIVQGVLEHEGYA